MERTFAPCARATRRRRTSFLVGLVGLGVFMALVTFAAVFKNPRLAWLGPTGRWVVYGVGVVVNVACGVYAARVGMPSRSPVAALDEEGVEVRGPTSLRRLDHAEVAALDVLEDARGRPIRVHVRVCAGADDRARRGLWIVGVERLPELVERLRARLGAAVPVSVRRQRGVDLDHPLWVAAIVGVVCALALGLILAL